MLVKVALRTIRDKRVAVEKTRLRQDALINYINVMIVVLQFGDTGTVLTPTTARRASRGGSTAARINTRLQAAKPLRARRFRRRRNA
jgi:hypothetical protein